MSFAHLRVDYFHAPLRKKGLHQDPFEQFQLWFKEAQKEDVPEPNAMTLATVNASGEPSTRIVLLKGLDERGFSFFTNYESRKGRDLAVNPKASLTFFWVSMARQIGITGTVTKLSEKESVEYFNSRPLANRWAAWVSSQSQAIDSREVLDQKLDEISARYPSEDVPKPPYWGGFVLSPATIEFWQGQPNRLHDRFRYSKGKDGKWVIERLSP